MTEQTYEPRGGARELMLTRAPLVVASGPAGTGKSLAAAWKTHLTALKVPGSRQLILRQTHASLTASTLVSFERDVIGPALAEGVVTWFGGSGRRPPAYIYSNKSEILVGGLDQPGKLLSTEYDRVFIDEASQCTATAVQVIATRLRGTAPTYKQLIMATNPDHPQHHLLLMTQEGRAQMIKSYHVDNPRFMNADGSLTPDGESYMPFLDGLTGTNRLRYRDGLWVAREGQVYDGWDESVHVVDPFEVPDDGSWRWIESLDFGFQHPMTWGRFAIDPDGRMFLVAEMSRRHRLVEDFASDILAAREDRGWGRPEALVTDHAAGDRATLERHLGEATVKARKDVSPGIQAVASRLAVQANGLPRFQVFRDSVIHNDPLAPSDKMPRGFVAEVGGYVWMTERGTDGIPKEAPVKAADDAADMVRYAVMYEDGAPPAKVGNPAKAGQQQPQQGGRWATPTGRPNGH